jgi:hypothetical protein
MLNPLQDNPFLQVEFIQKVVTDIVISNPQYTVIDTIIPDRDQDPSLGTTIQWDVDVYDDGGMTPAVDIGAESPILQGGGARQLRFSPPHFREKVTLDGTDILNLRQLGTINQQRNMAELVMKWTARLKRRLDNRRLWYKWQAVQSTAPLALEGVGTNQNFDYSSVGYHTGIGGASWDAIGATILDDIIDFISEFREAATIPNAMYFGTTILNALLTDATTPPAAGVPSIGGMIQSQIGYDVNPNNIFNPMPGQEGIITFMEKLFAGIRFVYNPFGPVVTLKTLKAAPTGAGPTSFACAGNYQLFALGDAVTLAYPDGTKFPCIVTALTPATGLVTLSHVLPFTVAVPKGAIIRKRYEFIDSDKVVLFADMPSGQEGGQVQAEYVSVANVHVDSGFDNPQSGVGIRLIRHFDDDPPRAEIIGSQSAGLVVYYDEGPWAAHSVIF